MNEFDTYKCLQVMSSRKIYDILGLCVGHLNERSGMKRNVDLPLKMQAQALHLVMSGVCVKIVMSSYLRLETLKGQRVPV